MSVDAPVTYANIYAKGLSNQESSARYERAFSELRARGGVELPHRVGGRALATGERFRRYEPSDRSVLVAEAFSADADVVDQAVAGARAAQREWGNRNAQERADVISRLVPLLREKREEVAALISLEVGKPRADAVVEIDESIVIIELSVRDYLEHDGFRYDLIKPGAAVHAGLTYRPYGVFGVIAPFNFPVAISFTMAVSALLTGNAVVLKPSAQTPASGQAVYDLLVDAGVPEGVINLVQGDGPTGALLARSAVDGIAFTGSAEVGLNLVAELSRPPYVRPVIAEMGGKNPAVISDKVGDIGVAARAVARSAFGMTGQKCTACSRAVVFDGVYDEFVDALAAEASSYVIADPTNPAAFAGPLSSEASIARFQRAVESGRSDGRIVTGGNAHLERGNFAELTVVDGLAPGHPLTREEIFGPVLSVIRVPDLDAALTEANDVPFGLSSGIFTADTAEADRFLDTIEAGIVFVNHEGGATTGVWPTNQTMSGWKASGTSGAGGFGPNYLQQFVREQSRTIYR